MPNWVEDALWWQVYPLGFVGAAQEPGTADAAPIRHRFEHLEAWVEHVIGLGLNGILLGPVFAARIVDWEPHLHQMFDFWSSVALMSGRYHGQPMRKHLMLPVDGRHFDRWLALFEATAADLCPPKAAAHFIERARRIAESIEMGVASVNGIMLARGERLHRPELDAAE